MTMATNADQRKRRQILALGPPGSNSLSHKICALVFLVSHFYCEHIFDDYVIKWRKPIYSTSCHDNALVSFLLFIEYIRTIAVLCNSPCDGYNSLICLTGNHSRKQPVLFFFWLAGFPGFIARFRYTCGATGIFSGFGRSGSCMRLVGSSDEFGEFGRQRIFSITKWTVYVTSCSFNVYRHIWRSLRHLNIAVVVIASCNVYDTNYPIVFVTFLMERGNREITKTRSNAFGNRLNAFACFSYSPFSSGRSRFVFVSYLCLAQPDTLLSNIIGISTNWISSHLVTYTYLFGIVIKNRCVFSAIAFLEKELNRCSFGLFSLGQLSQMAVGYF